MIFSRDINSSDYNTPMDGKYDVNGDGLVDAADHEKWVKNLKVSWFGDANLDGEFNSSDFVSVFTQGKYENGEAVGWAEGNWNGDGLFSSTDFVRAFTDGGYELGPQPAAVSAVPEPSALGLLSIGLGLLLWRRR